MMDKPIGPFKLAGEIGQPLGVAAVPTRILGAEGMRLTYRSLETSELTFSLPYTQTAPIADGQKLSLIDGHGRRIFAGEAKLRLDWRSGADSRWQVRVKDVFERMARTPLTFPVADEDGNTVTRQLFVFPRQNVALMMRQIIERAAALGLDVRPGRISPGYLISGGRLANQSVLEALAFFMQFYPDAGTRMDYDAPDGPRLDIIRRADATDVMLDIGPEHGSVQALDIELQPELMAKFVTILEARDTGFGELVWDVQRAGDTTAPAEARQEAPLSTISETESPRRSYPSALVTTYTDFRDYYIRLDTGIQEWLAEYEGNFGSIFQTAGVSSLIDGGTVNYVGGGATSTDYIRSATAFPAGRVGVVFGEAGSNAEPPEWLVEQLGATRVEISGHVWATHPQGTTVLIAESRAMLNSVLSPQLFWLFTISPTTFYRAVRPFREVFWTVPTAAAMPTAGDAYRVWRNEDLDQLMPPADLAANMLAAQAFVPAIGDAILGWDAPAIPQPGDLVSARGGPPAYSTARAAIAETFYDLHTGRTTLTLGPGIRAAAPTLLDRWRALSRAPAAP